jgi:predicted lipoprotein
MNRSLKLRHLVRDSDRPEFLSSWRSSLALICSNLLQVQSLFAAQADLSADHQNRGIGTHTQDLLNFLFDLIAAEGLT